MIVYKHYTFYNPTSNVLLHFLLILNPDPNITLKVNNQNPIISNYISIKLLNQRYRYLTEYVKRICSFMISYYLALTNLFIYSTSLSLTRY